MSGETTQNGRTDSSMNFHRKLYKEVGRLASEGKLTADEYTEFRTVYKDAFSIRENINEIDKYLTGQNAFDFSLMPREVSRVLKRSYSNVRLVSFTEEELEKMLRSCRDQMSLNVKLLFDHLYGCYERLSKADSGFAERYAALRQQNSEDIPG